MRSARASFVLLPATVFLAAAAAGQVPSPTGNLYGTALDEQAKFLQGTAVTLTGPGAAQATTTDTKGDFRFLNLSPGDYAVTLERAGFDTVRRDVTVTVGKNAVLAITMPVAGAEEAVTVSGQGSAMDSRQTTDWRDIRPEANWIRSRPRAIPGRSCGRFPACSSPT